MQQRELKLSAENITKFQKYVRSSKIKIWLHCLMLFVDLDISVSFRFRAFVVWIAAFSQLMMNKENLSCISEVLWAQLLSPFTNKRLKKSILSCKIFQRLVVGKSINPGRMFLTFWSFCRQLKVILMNHHWSFLILILHSTIYKHLLKELSIYISHFCHYCNNASCEQQQWRKQSIKNNDQKTMTLKRKKDSGWKKLCQWEVVSRA